MVRSGSDSGKSRGTIISTYTYMYSFHICVVSGDFCMISFPFLGIDLYRISCQ